MNIPRVVLANDLPAFGKVALAAALPVLSAMGIEACCLTTALLSSHGGWPGVRMSPQTGSLRDTLAHWRELGLVFDALAVGFVAEAEQFPILQALVDEQRGQGKLTLVDPVLGDNGRLYGLFDQSQVAAMRELASRAAIITPNLTEAALLLGRSANETPATPAELEDWLVRLAGDRVDLVVMTSAPVYELPPDTEAAGSEGAQNLSDWTAVVAWQRTPGTSGGTVYRFEHRREQLSFPGTGDVFAACLFGGLVHGMAGREAVEQATAFVHGLVAQSAEWMRGHPGRDPREGLRVEAFLAGGPA